MVWSPQQNGLPEGSSIGCCLSHFATVQIAAGETAPCGRDSLHMASCAACRARLVKERRRLTRDCGRPLTVTLLRAARMQSLRGGLRACAVSAGLLAVLTVLVLRPVQPALAAAPRTLLSGEVSKMGGEQVHLAPLTSLQSMVRGDRLTLRARVTEPMRAVLSAQDGGTPHIYFDGVLPSNGVLPVTVEVANEVPPHLRLELCPLSQADTSCDSFDLR